MPSPVFGEIFDSTIFGGSGGLFSSQFDYAIFDDDDEGDASPSVPRRPFVKSMAQHFMRPFADFAS